MGTNVTVYEINCSWNLDVNFRILIWETQLEKYHTISFPVNFFMNKLHMKCINWNLKYSTTSLTFKIWPLSSWANIYSWRRSCSTSSTDGSPVVKELAGTVELLDGSVKMFVRELRRLRCWTPEVSPSSPSSSRASPYTSLRDECPQCKYSRIQLQFHKDIFWLIPLYP